MHCYALAMGLGVNGVMLTLQLLFSDGSPCSNRHERGATLVQ